MQPERRGRRVGRSFLLALVLALIAFGGLSRQANAGGFCSSSEIREYSPPLKGMQPVPQPPYGSQKLPFGPSGLEILPVDSSHIAIEGGEIGFSMEGSLKEPQALQWDVSSRLSVVDRQGRIQRIVDRRYQRIGRLKVPSEARLAFHVGKLPRFYRVDVTFKDVSGRRLAHYADYFRVMPRRVDVRLGLNAASYRPGQVLLMRLENLGTIGISFGYEFALDVWDGSSWTTSPATPLGWEQVGFGIGAGTVQQCQQFRLPTDMAAGKYRLTKFFATSLAGRASHIARAIFEVTA